MVLEMDSRARASAEQFSTLLEFMESHGDLARPQTGAQGRVKAEHLWQELANILNSIGGGVNKTADKRKKVWADWKSKTKKKALTIRKHASGTGGGPRCNLSLTVLETRLLAIIGILAVEGHPEIEERGFDRPSTSATPLQNVGLNIEVQNASIPIPSATASGGGAGGSGDFCDRGSPLPVARSRESSPSSLPRVSWGQLQDESTAPPQPAAVAASPRPAATAAPPRLAATPRPTGAPRPAAAPRPATVRFSPPTTPLPSPNREAVSPLSSLTSPSRQRRMTSRRRRTLTPFDRAASEFTAIERHRLRLEEKREKNEARRLEIEHERTNVLNRFVNVAEAVLQYLTSRNN